MTLGYLWTLLVYMCGTIDPRTYIRWVLDFGIKTGYDILPPRPPLSLHILYDNHGGPSIARAHTRTEVAPSSVEGLLPGAFTISSSRSSLSLSFPLCVFVGRVQPHLRTDHKAPLVWVGHHKWWAHNTDGHGTTVGVWHARVTCSADLLYFHLAPSVSLLACSRGRLGYGKRLGGGSGEEEV
jgi:hypothetical protein